MKNDNLANLVKMQQSIAKAVTGNNGLTRLAEISQAVAGHHKKMLDNFPLAALAAQRAMIPELAGVASLRKQFQNPLLNNDFFNSMKVISENSFRIQTSWKKYWTNIP